MKLYRLSLLCIIENPGLCFMYHVAQCRTHLYIDPLKDNHLLEAKLKKGVWYDVATIGPT